MSLADSETFLENGGYLQKGPQINLRAEDLGTEVHDLLPTRWYRDEKIFQLEKRGLFSKVWMIASFAPRFKKAGDYVTMDVFGRPILLVRDKSGNINAFHNVCRHRGYPVATKQCGSTTVLSCKFHGWSYLSNGNLHRAREYDTLPGFDPEEHGLFKVHTHITSQGFIFVNLDAEPTPTISFEDQFGDDFDENPIRPTGQVVGHEFAKLKKSGWEYDQTWNSSEAGTEYNWKNFADGFQECYHCLTGHPTTLPKDFALEKYYLRQGYGASRHHLPPAKEGIPEAYITWLYPVGVIVFSDSLVFIERFTAKTALHTYWEQETYRREEIGSSGEAYEKWMREDVNYWRFVEAEDVQLAVGVQKGLNVGVLGKGRLHPTQEHAIKWYQDKVRKMLVDHAELEKQSGRNIDHAVPREQDLYNSSDPLCKLMGPELEF